MQKLLIIIGIALVVAGLLWPWLSKLPLGKLPGDIVIDRPNLGPVHTNWIIAAGGHFCVQRGGRSAV